MAAVIADAMANIADARGLAKKKRAESEERFRAISIDIHTKQNAPMLPKHLHQHLSSLQLAANSRPKTTLKR
jgi:hypothetical protein